LDVTGEGTPLERSMVLKKIEDLEAILKTYGA
jgi:hypothetical protein